MSFDAVYDLLHPDGQRLIKRGNDYIITIPSMFNENVKVKFRSFNTHKRMHSTQGQSPKSISSNVSSNDRVQIHVTGPRTANLSIPSIDGEPEQFTIKRAMKAVNSWFNRTYPIENYAYFFTQDSEGVSEQLISSERMTLSGFSGCLSPTSKKNGQLSLAQYDSSTSTTTRTLEGAVTEDPTIGSFTAFNGPYRVNGSTAGLTLYNGDMGTSYNYLEMPQFGRYKNEVGTFNIPSFHFAIDGPNGWQYALVSQQNRYLYLHWNDGHGNKGRCSFVHPSPGGSGMRNCPMILGFDVHYDEVEDKEHFRALLTFIRSDNWWYRYQMCEFTTESGRFVDAENYTCTKTVETGYQEKKWRDSDWLFGQMYGGFSHGYELIGEEPGRHFFHGVGSVNSTNFYNVADYACNFDLTLFACESKVGDVVGLSLSPVRNYTQASTPLDFPNITPIRNLGSNCILQVGTQTVSYVEVWKKYLGKGWATAALRRGNVLQSLLQFEGTNPTLSDVESYHVFTDEQVPVMNNQKFVVQVERYKSTGDDAPNPGIYTFSEGSITWETEDVDVEIPYDPPLVLMCDSINGGRVFASPESADVKLKEVNHNGREFVVRVDGDMSDYDSVTLSLLFTHN